MSDSPSEEETPEFGDSEPEDAVDSDDELTPEEAAIKTELTEPTEED